jgi:hypothetical protein
MKKKLLIFFIFVSLVFYSCLDYTLPERLKLELEGSVDLPVKTATGNWISALVSSLGDKFPDDIEIYNVNHGQEIQALCIYMPIEISETLNPDDYMDKIADLQKWGSGDEENAFEIDESINIPSFDNVELLNEPIPIPSSGVVPIYFPGKPLGLSDEFLHARIEEGNFTINLDIYDEYDNPVEVQKNYNINIIQAPDTYPGFGVTPPTNITSAVKDLKGKDINRNPITIDGTITFPHPGGTLKGHLTIKMSISKYEILDWHFRDFYKDQKPNPVSLAKISNNLNWIKFNKCAVNTNPEPKEDFGKPIEGIGIDIKLTELSDELKSKLEMSVKCDELLFGDNNKKSLDTGYNAFGNAEALTGKKRLQLAVPPAPPDPEDPDYPDVPAKAVNDLQFYISIFSAGGNDVLQLEHLEAGKPLVIKGDAKIFQKWTSANVNMKNSLKGQNDGGFYEGVFPKEGGKNIDLSTLNDYLPGFEFMKEDVTAMVYLSGPNDPQSPVNLLYSSLEIDVKYPGLSDTDPFYIIERGTITPEKKHIIFKSFDKDNKVKYNDKYIKETGPYISYIYDDKKNNYLPPDGNPIGRFNEIVNDRPTDLQFHYNGEMPPDITVYPSMFSENNIDISSQIAAAIILYINFKLTAVDKVELTNGNRGAVLKFPDMFDAKKDLLGRNPDNKDPSKPEENSMFTSLDVSYINFVIEFAGALFNGGRFFIEKGSADDSPKLYPQGIRVDGKSISINIKNKDFEIIKNKIIYPDIRLEFEEGKAITIPRNMGLTRVKIEAKGKNSLTLDF